MEEDPEFIAGEFGGKRMRQVDPAETTIDSLFQSHRKCVYEYDFGDSWEHEIVVEKKLPESEGAPAPVRLAGARHRPPEDVGGVGGRYENLAWAQKDTRGRLFDPACPHGSKSQLSHPTSLPARNP